MSIICIDLQLQNSFGSIGKKVPKMDIKKMMNLKKMPKFIQERGFLKAKGQNTSRSELIDTSVISIQRNSPSNKHFLTQTMKPIKSIQRIPAAFKNKRTATNAFQIKTQDLRKTADTQKFRTQERQGTPSIYVNPSPQQSISPRRHYAKNYHTGPNSPKQIQNSINSLFSAKKDSSKTNNNKLVVPVKELKVPSFLKKKSASNAQNFEKNTKFKTLKTQANIPTFLKKKSLIKIYFNQEKGLKIIKQTEQLNNNEKNSQRLSFNLSNKISFAKQVQCSEKQNTSKIRYSIDFKDAPFKKLQFMKHKVTKTQECSSPGISQIDHKGMEELNSEKFLTKLV